jgi:hypothetical protein
MYEFSPGTSSTSLEAGLEPNRLSFDLNGSLDGFLSNVAMLTLKSMQKEFDILRTELNTWKHYYLMMVTKPRVKGADNTPNVTAQRE